jgi:hypothetical protein
MREFDMFINGKFQIPSGWPKDAQRELVAICAGDFPAWARRKVILPDFTEKPRVGVACAFDGETGTYTVRDPDDGGSFDLDGLCVAIEAVMRHYDIPGSVCVVTTGTGESADEISSDALVTRISQSGRWDLNTTELIDCDDDESARRMLRSISELPALSISVARRISSIAEELVSEVRCKSNLTYAVSWDDDVELKIYVLKESSLGEMTVKMRAAGDARAEEILTEALQSTKVAGHFFRVKIFSSEMPPGTAETMASLAEHAGYRVTVDRSDFHGKGRDDPAGHQIADKKNNPSKCEEFFVMARKGTLPPGFSQWELKDKWARTVAHAAAERGHLPPGFDRWDMKDDYDVTVARKSADAWLNGRGLDDEPEGPKP